jgi:hypothetical protein
MRRLAPLFLVLVIAAAPSAWAIPAQLGVSYSAWNQDLTDPGTFSQLQQSVQEMKAAGVKWVALNTFEFQDTLASTTIAPDYGMWSTTDASLQAAINEFKANGIQVLLKPMVDVKSGDWRGNIPPSGAWFTEYQGFITDWANKATTWGADALSVGCEFRDTIWTPGWDDEWRSTVDAARAAFAGPMTYAANHDSYQDVSWWDAVDFVGIDAYFPLTSDLDPLLAQLLAEWNGHADAIEAWLAANHPDMDVLFTEIGYTNLDGTNILPNAYWMHGPGVDELEQAQCYFAALQETWNRDWMSGYYWWIWDTQPGGGGYNAYTPQGNQAYYVLYEFYTPEPGTCALLGLGTIALLRRRRRRLAA